jgi:hypothetical protein
MDTCWACKGTGEILVVGMLAGYPQSRCEVCKGLGTPKDVIDGRAATFVTCICKEIDEADILLATGCPIHDPIIAPTPVLL